MTALVIATLNVNILLHTLAHFGHSWLLLSAWLQSILVSLAVGWGIVDVAVIIIRNNLRPSSWFTSRFARGLRQTRLYQVLDTFVVEPMSAVIHLLFAG